MQPNNSTQPYLEKTMDELTQLCQTRSEIYWWLSTTLATELSDEQLGKYQSAEIQGFLQGLAATPALTAPVEKLVSSLAAANLRNDARLELCADYAQIFLGNSKSSAPPYESVFTSENGHLMQEAYQQMTALLEQHNINISDKYSEPADHIAIQLDFMGNLILKTLDSESEEQIRANFALQHDFLQTHLLNWLGDFEMKVKDCDKFGFYAAVVALLLAFAQLDSDWLETELD
jgi:TorA-specific chaperone